MTDIVERLRTPASDDEWMELMAQRIDAADEIERLRAALRWFVSEYDRVQPMRQARVHAPECRCILCACDNARAALKEDADE